MNRLFVSVAATALLAASAIFGTIPTRAQSSPVPFGDGENLPYTVSYRAKLIPPINMMRVSLRTVGENLGGAPHYHVIGNGRTTGGVSGIFSLNDTFHTWLDGRTLLPSRMTSDQHEDNYHFRATYNYDWQAMRVSNVRRNAKWDSDLYAEIPLRENSGDALSLFFRMRALDLQSLSPGVEYPLDLVLGEGTRPIAFRYLGREELKIRRTGTFRALKFVCTMATEDGSTFEEGMAFTIWISDDANKIPLLIDCPIRIGRVRVTLTEGYRVLHPMDSLVK